MCNLFAQTRAADILRQALEQGGSWENRAGNLEPGDIYPDRLAPIITAEGAGHVLRRARWGLPSPPQYHSPSGIDRGVTNVRNSTSPHCAPVAGAGMSVSGAFRQVCGTESRRARRGKFVV